MAQLESCIQFQMALKCLSGVGVRVEESTDVTFLLFW